MKSHTYHIVYQAEPEGGYTVMVPALQGCVTYGQTIEEARTMAKDAITGYLSSLRKHNERIPSDQRTLVDTVEVRGHSSKLRKSPAYA